MDCNCSPQTAESATDRQLPPSLAVLTEYVAHFNHHRLHCARPKQHH
jgi:hypothetical protein